MSSKLAGPGRSSVTVPEDTTRKKKLNSDQTNWRTRNNQDNSEEDSQVDIARRQTRFDGEIEIIPDKENDDVDDEPNIPETTDTGLHQPREKVNPNWPFNDVRPLTVVPTPGPPPRHSYNKEPIPRETDKQPAYQNKAPVQSDKRTRTVINKVMDAPISLTTAELASCSPDVRDEIKRLMSKKRISPTTKKQSVTMHEELDIEHPNYKPLPETWDLAISQDHVAPQGMINVLDLPLDNFMVTGKAYETAPPGGIMVGDPILSYLSSLKDGEEPQEIYVAQASQSLRTVYPRINNVKAVESVLDGGSQIISMDLEEAKQLCLVWDPDITINMQSANKGIEKTEGLARNVPFLFKDITLYLQVHVIKDVAYKVLLGRPFDVLTTSTIQNNSDGGQLITITDPNTGRRNTLPTSERGKPPVIAKSPHSEGVFQRSMI